MDEEQLLKQSQTVFKTVCEMLDEDDWKYKADEEDLSIYTGATGEDLPFEIRINVNAERQLIILLSFMPFTVPEHRREAMAVAVAKANYGLGDGSFDYDYKNGTIVFRLTSSYLGSLVGKELVRYMLLMSCSTIDNYNDKFLMVAKNDMTNEEVADFIE